MTRLAPTQSTGEPSMTSSSGLHRWFPFGTGDEGASRRLFCLPFAGGGASNFLAWRAQLAGVGVVPVQYPGHETRIGEALVRDWDTMLAALVEALLPLLDRPYVLYGHSMGARLAFAAAGRLDAVGLAPERVIVAAHLPPGQPSAASAALNLDDEDFKHFLQRYGGIPAELPDEPRFWDRVLPVMRADFALATQPLKALPLRCPVIAYAGREDAEASAPAMRGWQAWSRAGFALREFAGGHFFFRHPDVAAALNADLKVAPVDSLPLVSA